MILHIATKKEWETAGINGEYTVESLDTEGFIHCSTLMQVGNIADLFFKGETGLVLLCLDEKKLTSKCKYEKPVGNIGEQYNPRIDDLFPHIYGPINISAVIEVVDFPPKENGLFEIPKELLNNIN